MKRNVFVSKHSRRMCESFICLFGKCYHNEMMPMARGLPLALGVSKSTWENYKKREDFEPILIRVEVIVEKYLEL